MLLLKMPPITSTTAIDAMAASDSVSNLFGCWRLIIATTWIIAAFAYLRLVFTYLRKRDLRRVLVFHDLRSALLRINSVNECRLCHRGVFERHHDYLVIL